VSSPGEGATASLVSGAVELSNADIGQSIIEITLASQSFRANAAVLSSADSLLDELSHLRRA
jgi:flagellar hook protein FlgE